MGGDERCDPGSLSQSGFINHAVECVFTLVFMQTLKNTVNSDGRQLNVD